MWSLHLPTGKLLATLFCGGTLVPSHELLLNSKPVFPAVSQDASFVLKSTWVHLPTEPACSLLVSAGHSTILSQLVTVLFCLSWSQYYLAGSDPGLILTSSFSHIPILLVSVPQLFLSNVSRPPISLLYSSGWVCAAVVFHLDHFSPPLVVPFASPLGSAVHSQCVMSSFESQSQDCCLPFPSEYQSPW